MTALLGNPIAKGWCSCWPDKARQRNDVGAGIVKLQPAGVLTRAVGDARQVVGLQFVEQSDGNGSQRSATLLSLPGVADKMPVTGGAD